MFLHAGCLYYLKEKIMARDSLKSVMRLIDTAAKELTPEQGFLADLKKSIEVDDLKGYRKPSQTYKPSGMNCIRSMYYQVVGRDVKPSTSGYMMVGICNSGTDTHVRMQDYIENMKDNGIDCEYIDVADFIKIREFDDLEVREKCGMETKLYHKKLNMSFMTDGIIRYKGKYYILEIKTEASFKWQNRKDVDPKHYNQATAYSIAFGLSDVIFLYINRDVMDMKAYMYHVTDEMKQDLIGKIDACDGYVKRKITPPKPEDLPRNACTYCSYKEVCDKE